MLATGLMPRSIAAPGVGWAKARSVPLRVAKIAPRLCPCGDGTQSDFADPTVVHA